MTTSSAILCSVDEECLIESLNMQMLWRYGGEVGTYVNSVSVLLCERLWDEKLKGDIKYLLVLMDKVRDKKLCLRRALTVNPLTLS